MSVPGGRDKSFDARTSLCDGTGLNGVSESAPPSGSPNDHLEGFPKQEVMGCAGIRAMSEAFMENSNLKVPIAPPETKVSVDTIVQ